MADVALRIGGRNYTIACQDGQEAHIMGLGRAIESKLEGLGPAARQNEPRALLFAALLLADEADELRKRAPVAAPPPDGGSGIASGLETLATRLEKLAESLEG
ncbi:MAG: cell division protein ZapA [Candidatus Andeanibacterium colombiense]|uniref:Cell division protein ZapA n=1 Tax=Candidatus Andeanibacterium colombiense TaxID=3121345 RepID=A0AAJ5XAJ3_9SPHN|nr:MAG: cell division protein ZapA [Sphingomonadaceae bacterium]